MRLSCFQNKRVDDGGRSGQSLGLKKNAVKFFAFCAVILFAGSAVAITGHIAFVEDVAPIFLICGMSRLSLDLVVLRSFREDFVGGGR